jgi:hypothetical protein
MNLTASQEATKSLLCKFGKWMGIRGHKPNYVRVFAVYGDVPTSQQYIEEVTSRVARMCNLRTTKDCRYIIIAGTGHNHVDAVGEAISLILGEEIKIRDEK